MRLKPRCRAFSVSMRADEATGFWVCSLNAGERDVRVTSRSPGCCGNGVGIVEVLDLQDGIRPLLQPFAVVDGVEVAVGGAVFGEGEEIEREAIVTDRLDRQRCHAQAVTQILNFRDVGRA